jgi:hypothetical protein
LNRDGNFAILLILRNKSLEAAFNTTALSFFPQDYQSICGLCDVAAAGHN